MACNVIPKITWSPGTVARHSLGHTQEEKEPRVRPESSLQLHPRAPLWVPGFSVSHFSHETTGQAWQSLMQESPTVTSRDATSSASCLGQSHKSLHLAFSVSFSIRLGLLISDSRGQFVPGAVPSVWETLRPARPDILPCHNHIHVFSFICLIHKHRWGLERLKKTALQAD